MAGFIKRTVKKTFNVSKWAGVDHVKQDTRTLGSLFKSAFAKPHTENLPYDETFEDAVNRLGLTEKDLIERQKQFFKNAMAFLAMALLISGYMLFLLFNGHIVSGLFCIFLALLALVNFYRFHFWYIQIKHRVLGLSFKQWLALALNGKRNP
jgi:intracellular multiplication protein IcmV